MIPISARIFPAALLVAAVVSVVTGCSASPGAGAASSAAVRINGQEIPASDFEAYLAASFGEDLPPVEDAETRSRLLDQFIEERLLLQQAEERKIQVEEEKVDAYLTSLGAGTESGPDAGNAASLFAADRMIGGLAV